MNRCEFVFKFTHTNRGEVRGETCGARTIPGHRFCRDCDARHHLTPKIQARYRRRRERIAAVAALEYVGSSGLSHGGPMSARTLTGRLPTHSRLFHVQRVGR